MRLSRRKVRKAHLGQSIPHSFSSKRLYSQFLLQ